ncbi:MFS transporter [Mycolicibacterium moriokaense]|nr:MFS transporter [Mycolicibacterium moriokaense]
MGRKVAVAWHASFSIAAGILYFFFVLPRWPELRGTTSHTLGTVLRIVTGAVIGLAGLPVVFTLLRTRKPELGTPQLALSLRTSSIGLHVLAGVLIVGTAISEIWLSLDSAGRWLFGIYGAAAAVAMLGIAAFYLAFVAELPPPPPKPLKPKKEKKSRRRGRKDSGRDYAEDSDESDETDETATEKAEEAAETEEAEETGVDADEDQPSEQPVTTGKQPEQESAESDESTEEHADDQQGDLAQKTNGSESSNGGLRNRRTSGKITLRRRKRSRGGVALED